MRTVTLNGQPYAVPEPNETGYGANLLSYLVALSTAFPQLGGAATLLAELDLGANFGLKALYLKSETANPAGSGFVRLAAADAVAWRNAANSADMLLAKDAGDALTYGGQNVTGNAFFAGSTSALAIPTGSPFTVPYSTIEVDTDSAYNLGLGKYTIPAGKDGQYSIVGQVAWNGALATTTQVAIFKNGAEMKRAEAVNPGANASLAVNAILVLVAGDVIDIRATQASGGSSPLSNTAALNFLTIKRLTA